MRWVLVTTGHVSTYLLKVDSFLKSITPSSVVLAVEHRPLSLMSTAQRGLPMVRDQSSCCPVTQVTRLSDSTIFDHTTGL